MAVMESVLRYRWVILGLAMVSQLSNNIATQVVAPLAPLLQPELGLSKAEVGIFSTATFAGAWGVLLVAGSLTDRFGVRKMMSIGQMVAGSLLLLMALVGSFFEAVLVMLAVGLGRGAVHPGGTKAIVDWFPLRERATAMGLKQTGYPMAGILTASILPAVALALGWRAAMGLAGLAVVVAGTVTLILYREPPDSKRGPARGASAGVGVAVVLRNRKLWILSLVAMLFVTAQMSLNTYLVLYLNDVVLVPSVPDERTRLLVAGGYLALCLAGGVLGRVLWGVASDRFFHGRRMRVLALIGVLAASLFAVLGHLGPGFSPWLLAVLVFAQGGTATAYSGVYHTSIAETVGRKHAATGVGLSMTVGQFGTVAGPPLFGYIVDVTGSYQPAWIFVAAISALGTAVAAASARAERHVS